MSEIDKRLQLQSKFEEILGSRKVYFQPPETMKIDYPCIIYFKSNLPISYANNGIYKQKQGYTVTYVDKNPDSEMPNTILHSFEYIRIDSYYRSEGLNHTKFILYY